MGALHCVYHTDNFMAAVTKCVNFLGDADSTGSVTGQLAGAFYGFSQIDDRCIANLNEWDENQVALRGAMLYILGEELRDGQVPGERTAEPESDDADAQFQSSSALQGHREPQVESTSAPRHYWDLGLFSACCLSWGGDEWHSEEATIDDSRVQPSLSADFLAGISTIAT